MAKKKIRLDLLLVKRGLAPAVDKAQALIGAGKVKVNGLLSDKAGTAVLIDSDIEITTPSHPYVSRGGIKLIHALSYFSINVSGLICMDVGASTGGFTDCLLKNGALKVYAVDVGYGQMDWVLRNDPRVVLMERTNIRHLPGDAIRDPIEIAAVDVSFISLKAVTPALLRFMKPGGKIVALIKPQFEVARERVERGGIVKDPASRQEAVDDLIHFFKYDLGLDVIGVTPSPILGIRGNTEFLIYMQVNNRYE
ncbi:TlyA family RNA methyltransferase [Dissulfurimicrobium hydrothermale]|uniref:TlyA family RNA methyltransferase n=2 Tax=Dissulfurimicrobium TaxID=1769732 RepID=UPI001EDBA35E|nr:TlyA family RNA methyltransferase [Dissulfurimicrobium hydrothermale]UKL12943.1 TlyA family RNA methyltransferase [Dissulfurimicrobium hydrothermale]